MRSDIGALGWDKLQDCKTLLIHLLCTVMNLGLEFGNWIGFSFF